MGFATHLTKKSLIFGKDDKEIVLPVIREGVDEFVYDGESIPIGLGLHGVSAINLIKELMAVFQTHSEDLAAIFPDRIYKYCYAMLARLWGHDVAYVNNLIFKQKRINDKALLRLNERINSYYGEKAFKCHKIIVNYRNLKISLDGFIRLICAELGRISGEISITHEEASHILGINIDCKIADIQSNYPNYKFSLENLDLMGENIEFYFKEAEKCHNLIQNYISMNKDLKEYSRQQHNVGRPHYFERILPGEVRKAYLLGFIGHDGYIGKNTVRIILAIQPRDIEVIHNLIDAISLDLGNVQIRDEIRTYLIDGEKIVRKYIILDFQCKIIHGDLQKLGFIGAKIERKEIPDSIKNLIEQAKSEDYDMWMDTLSGKTALAWVLGFYDSDGSYSGYTNGRLYSANKEYLMEIKKLFEIETNVNKLTNPGEKVWIIDRFSISKGFYYLYISSRNIFIKMMKSYWDSLDRKRPDEYKSVNY